MVEAHFCMTEVVFMCGACFSSDCGVSCVGDAKGLWPAQQEYVLFRYPTSVLLHYIPDPGFIVFHGRS